MKSCLLLAGLLAEGHDGRHEPDPTRDHTERMLRAAGARVSAEEAGPPATTWRPAGAADHGRARRAPRARRARVPGDFSSAAFFLVAAPDRARQRGPDRGRRPQPDPHRPARDPDPDGRRRSRSIETAAARRRARGRPSSPARARCRRPRRGRRGPAGDRRAAAGRAARLLRRGRDGRPGAEELRHKESDRIATVVDGLARRSAPRSRRTEDGFVVSGTGGLRGRRDRRAGDHRMAMLGAVAGLASREGVEVDGIRGRRGQLPGVRVGPASATQLTRPERYLFWLGWPSPGHGESTSSRRAVIGRADLVALVRVEVARAAPGRR